MAKTKNKSFYLTFAGLTCQIIGNEEVFAFFKKYFRDSALSMSLVRPKNWTKPEKRATCKILLKQSPFSETSFSFTQKENQYTVFIHGDLYFYYPLMMNVMQRIFGALFYQVDGLVLHGSAVIKQNKAYLFLGHSGKGKTTSARLSEQEMGYPIIADNKIFLRLEDDGKIYVHPFPFDSLHGRNLGKVHYEVGRALIVHQSKKHTVKSLNFISGLHILRQGIQIQNLNPQKLLGKETFWKILFFLLKEDKMSELFFAKNAGFWHHIEKYEKQKNKKVYKR